VSSEQRPAFTKILVILAVFAKPTEYAECREV